MDDKKISKAKRITIVDADEAKYFAEAKLCYDVGAHRAAIVMTSNAVFGYLRRLMHKLAEASVQEAVWVRDTIEQAIEANKGFEGILIEKLYSIQEDRENPDKKKRKGYDDSKYAGLIEREQINALRTINTYRNRAAHPRGSKESGENARHAMELAVEHFLGRKVVPAGIVIPMLMQNLEHESFFVDRSVEKLLPIVSENLKLIGDEELARTRLVSDLVKLAADPTSPAKSNAADFILGMLLLKGPAAKLSARLVFEKAVRARQVFELSRDEFLAGIFAVQPSLLKLMTQAERQRADLLFRNHVVADPSYGRYDAGHPMMLLEGMLSRSASKDIHNFPLFLSAIVERHWDDPFMVDALLDERVAASILTKILDCAGSYLPEDEDRLTYFVQKHDAALSTSISREKLFGLVVSLSSTNWRGAAKDLHERHFQRIPAIRAQARAYGLQEQPGRLSDLNLGPRPQHDPWRRFRNQAKPAPETQE